MFGVLTVHMGEELSHSRRALLRLRPATGTEYREDLFRMAMFATVQVTLCPGWSDSLRQKRVRAGLQWLRAKGARRVVLPEEWHGLTRELELAPIGAEGALEACGAQAIAEACGSMGLPMGQVCLAVYGRRISHSASMQILTLAKSLRTVRIYGEGNEELRTRLWRSCGIVDRGPMPENAPVVGLLLPGGEARGETLLTVDLSGGTGAGEGLLWTPQPLPPQGVLAKLPLGADPTAFANAFLQAGALQAREIHVSRLDIPDCTQYNKETVEKCF